MANTINDLYLKYTNKVGKTLENDRYFRYLFEMVQAGNNQFQHNNRILHKVVDERWLTTIEESIDAINTIIEKPRRFVTTKEEVVPVALAKKISADSVRHLSMNTQFIASDEDGDIQPTRILNVSTEETYDLYENRFIYHLIQRLVTFIDKRTDVIFWSTGDEITNTLLYQSKVDDAYEEIEYKIEMIVKNRQNFAENDTDNMSVFMRIDRVRRLVMALRNSSFCQIMAGCAKVRSPIQRTNLIMKDPHYRTCYKLWQFLESYDEVGYTIEEQDTAMEFDEEYLIQMYTNLITNYTVFKSLMETDSRKIDTATKKRRSIKPKFIKKVEEQIVDDYDIPDVEVRKVIIEEVTQAQLDAEAKLAEETEARQKAEQELEDMDGQIVGLQQQIADLMYRLQQAEIRSAQDNDARTKAEAEALEAVTARKTAEETAKQAIDDRDAMERSMEDAIAEKLAAEEAAKKARLEMEQAVSEAAADRQARELAETAMQETKAEAEETVTRTQAEAQESIAKTKAEAEETVARTQTEAQESIAKIKAEAEAIVTRTQNDARSAISQTKQDADRMIADAKAEAEALVIEARRAAADTVTRMEQDCT